MNIRTWTLSIALIALLTSCAASQRRAERNEQALGRYMDSAGEPVDRFSYLRGMTNWQALTRDKLVVWTGVNDAYLLTVQTPCSNLMFANSIGLTNNTGSVSRGFDSVLVGGDRCQITEIRPVDYKKYKELARAGG